MKIHYLDTIISPNVTEKSTSLSEYNKVVFRVDKKANKKSIKKNIERIFKVKVIKVNTINIREKVKIVRNKKSYKLNYLILILIAYVGIFSTVSVLPRYKLIILPLQIIFTNVLIDKIIKKFFLEKQNNWFN